MFAEEVMKLLDLAIDMEDDKKEDILEVVKTARITLEVGGVVVAGLTKLYESYKSPDLTAAERTQMFIETRKKLEALKNA